MNRLVNSDAARSMLKGLVFGDVWMKTLAGLLLDSSCRFFIKFDFVTYVEDGITDTEKSLF